MGSDWAFTLVGHDRAGIVAEVSQVLARHSVNVEKLATYTSAAPMSGETLFHASATLRVGSDQTMARVKAELEALSHELLVDIELIPGAAA